MVFDKFVVPDACTVQESLDFRKLLRTEGEDKFLAETVENGFITAKKLCTAFGIRPPAFLEGQADEAYYNLLGLGICRELSKRVKLPQYNTIDDVVTLLQKSNNIIVLTGAGVSPSLFASISQLTISSHTDLHLPRHPRLPLQNHRPLLPTPVPGPF